MLAILLTGLIVTGVFALLAAIAIYYASRDRWGKMMFFMCLVMLWTMIGGSAFGLMLALNLN